MNFDYKVAIGLVLQGNVERRIMEISAKFSTLEKRILGVQAIVTKLEASMMGLGQKASGQASVIGQAFVRTSQSAYDLGAAFKAVGASSVKMGDEAVTAIDNATLAAHKLKRTLGGISATPVRINMVGGGGSAGRGKGSAGEGGFLSGASRSMPLLAAGGLLTYGLYESAKTQGIVSNTMAISGINPGSPSSKPMSDEVMKMITKASTDTGISRSETAKMFMATRQVDSYLPIATLEKLFPTIARAALIQQQIHGTSPIETAKSISEFSHQIGAYDPKSMIKFINYVNWVTSKSPESLPRFLNASAYAMPTGRAMLNVDPFEIIESIAFMKMAGINNTKSGTWLSNAMLNAIPKMHGTGLFPSGNQYNALSAMGEVDAKGTPQFFANGKASPLKMIHIFLKWADKIKKSMPAPQALSLITQEAGMAWGKQGSRFVALAMSPGYERALQTFNPANSRSVDSEFGYMSKNNPMIQGQKLMTNLSNALQKLADPLIPALTANLVILNGILGKSVNATPHVKKWYEYTPIDAAWALANKVTQVGISGAGVAHDAFSALLSGATEAAGMANGGMHVTIHDKTSGGIHAQIHRRQIHETGSTLTHSGVIPATVGGAH